MAVVLGIAVRLPARARLALGAWIGRTAVALVPKFRRRIAANLMHVLPGLDPAAQARIRRGVGDNFGRTFIDLLNNPAYHARRDWTGPVGPGIETVLAAGRAGIGAVLVTGHFGQWEAVRAWLRSEGLTCAGVYRPTENPHLNALYLRNLEAGGAPILPKGTRGLRGIVAHVARGGMIAILTDQYDRRARPFDFLGRPAPTITAPAEIALKFNVPLVPCYGLRQPDGRTQVVIEAAIPRGSAAEMTQAINDSLAARVRQHPEQYYWLHRRWQKSLPGL